MSMRCRAHSSHPGTTHTQGASSISTPLCSLCSLCARVIEFEFERNMTATMQHGGEGSRRRAATQPASPWWHRQHHHRLAALCVCSAAAIVLLASQPCSALHNAQDAAADAALHSTQSAAWSRGRRQGGSGGVAWAATARHAAQALLGALSAASQPLAHGHSSSVLPAAADLHVAASGDGSVGDVALELQPTHGRQLLSSRVGTVGVAIFLILFFM